MVIPPAMPLSKGSNKNKDKYKIAVRQFQQQILPSSMPSTTVWSYGSVDNPSTFNYPAFTIEAQWNKKVQVQWRNELVDAMGNYLSHLLPVDQTLHWANPPGGNAGRDMHGASHDPYLGPVPIVIQDRAFNQDGTLFYPDNRAFFEENMSGTGNLDPDQLQIPFWGDPACDTDPSDVPPIWQPEYFGNVMVVNGVSWPKLQVEQQQYRFRLLNGCNSRFLILDFSGITGVKVWQIGADGGFLDEPVDITTNENNKILMAPAERADVIVDFRGVPANASYELKNLGPDDPFGGGDFDPADPATTGKVMRFDVVARGLNSPGPTAFTEPSVLVLPNVTAPTGPNPRPLSLIEEESNTVLASFDNDGNLVLDCESGSPFGPTAALLGASGTEADGGKLWSDPITENPAVGATETWEIHNFTADAHPIHIHLVQFQVVGREVMGGGTSLAGSNDPLPGETGFKDTVIAYPGEITRVQATFDKAGLFVWHCHIVEHEDNEMMRPYQVG
jgi:FtsP/CotA-like multicopper oxidase with cupredoxin domain